MGIDIILAGSIRYSAGDLRRRFALAMFDRKGQLSACLRLARGYRSTCWSVSPKAFAENYPSRPIRIVVPTQAGAGQDILARLLQPHLEKSLGQPIIVENRSGASTMIGRTRWRRPRPTPF